MNLGKIIHHHHCHHHYRQHHQCHQHQQHSGLLSPSCALPQVIILTALWQAGVVALI